MYDAVVVYNSGETGRLPIFSHLGLSVGMFMKKAFIDIDRKRVVEAEKQITEAAKSSRRRRQVTQAATRAGDDSYEAGAF